MGNSASSNSPVFTGLTGQEKRSLRHQSRRGNYPDPYHSDQYTLREFLHDWKHSRNYVLHFSYPLVEGAIFGTLIGASIIHPMTTHSPYLYRKVAMAFRPSEFIPSELAKITFRNFTPQYGIIGGVFGFWVCFTSELFDHMFDANIFTKFGVLGAIDGAILGKMTGSMMAPFRYSLIGATVGLLIAGARSYSFSRLRGDVGYSVEYFPHVTEEEKRRYELQEIRIMGGNPELVLKR
ncbi:unnamed protein product [Blepharisma stoltei]|uniref:NADH-ubiquinone oxidoreductase 21kDa subunit N-terminal domain-containing protein n=1 Tax=Blepharisma stoltei TaxID=1481888 RepID=A0AAU9JYI2_9CILI|nr:unnamed protein product [Blepharisma stoltei]